MNADQEATGAKQKRSLRASLTDKILRTDAKDTPFRQAVLEAVRLNREAERAVRFGDARDEKLSARAYVREAMANARSDAVKVLKMEKRLKETDGHDMLDALIANAYQQMVATRVDKGCALRPPSQNLHMVVGIQKSDMSTLLMEAMMAGTTPLECVALAAIRAITDAPDAFGTIDDFDKHESRQRARVEAFQSACVRIRDDVRMDDLDITPIDMAQSLYRVTFKWDGKDTGIGLGAPDGPQRLVSYVAGATQAAG